MKPISTILIHCSGYDDDTLPMFKTNNMIVEASSSPFITPARYTDEPLMAGFSDKRMVALMAESTAVTTQKMGRGVVIGFTDNTQFEDTGMARTRCW